jgi:predicted phage terminase large subunit-like protein
LTEGTKNRDFITQLKRDCLLDVELFSISYFPHYCRHPFNEFHRDYFKSIQPFERRVRRADGAPRGYAKSTHKALIKVIHDIVYGLENFILIFSNTEDQATGKLKDIRRELLTNEDLIRDFGATFVGSRPAETSFIVECRGHQTMLASYGSGAEVRGIRFGAHRPSKIVCDDVEHSEEVFNEEIRRKYEDWFMEVVSKIGDENTNIEFIGTILHRESLLKKLTQNPAYRGKVYRAVISWAENQTIWEQWKTIYCNRDDDLRLEKADAFFEANKDEMLRGTQVLWPEKEPYYALIKELVETGRRAFMKEKQNEPTGVQDKLFHRFHYYQETAQGLYIEGSKIVVPWSEIKHQCFGVLDPATGQTKAKKGKLGDYSCILTGYKDHRNRLLVHSAYLRRSSPSVYISEIFEHHTSFHYNKFGVETNLYRGLLLPNILDEKARREKADKGKKIDLAFYEIEQTDNKEKRIFTLEPRVDTGLILFNRALPIEFMNQLEDFPHADHDDGPDALEMLWGLVNNRYKVSELNINVF